MAHDGISLRRNAWIIPVLAVVVLAASLPAMGDDNPRPASPQVELLWPDGAPGAVGDEPADKPSLTIFPAPKDKANGAAVVICPGGGYGHLAVDHEGRQIADWFNSLGVSAFVLRYRIAPYRHPAPRPTRHEAFPWPRG